MRRLLLAALLLVFAVDSADARKRRYRHHPYFVVVPNDAQATLDRRFDANPRDRQRMRGDRRGPVTLADVVPAGWQLQPPDPNWQGKRYISPDGAAWFAAYRSAADGNAIAEHMKTIAFADNETITYLRGERAWIAVSGFKDSRIFYRKAMLACAGKSWHHVAFEYPAEQKAAMDRLVILAAQALDASQAECEEPAVAAGR